MLPILAIGINPIVSSLILLAPNGRALGWHCPYHVHD